MVRPTIMILDYAGLDAIIGREPGKRRPERIPNAADPFDSPEHGITGEVVNRIDGIHHP